MGLEMELGRLNELLSATFVRDRISDDDPEWSQINTVTWAPNERRGGEGGSEIPAGRAFQLLSKPHAAVSLYVCTISYSSRA